MNIFVTGATGFVGSSIARALLKRGDDVEAMARPGSNRGRLAATAVSWTSADLTQPDTLSGIFHGADAVVHAAGRLGEFGVPDDAYFQLHVEGTRALCAELLSMPTPPRLLYISSPGVLGPINGPPATEDAPLAPSNVYERSKADAETLVRANAEQGLPVVIARPEFIYGPGDTHVLGLFQAVQNGRFFYIGDGHNTCHPTYVDDAVNGILRALDAGRQGELYHIAGPEAVTFRELAATIAAALDVPEPRLALPRPLALSGAAVLEGAGRLTGFKPPLSRDGVAFFSENRRFSWAKAQQELSYEPQVNLTDGIARTVAWYREQGYL
jgi:nucleoside-diphosphate-sugar epimerase